MNTFLKDLNTGKKVEYEIASFLVDKYNVSIVSHPDQYLPEYDFIIHSQKQNREMKIEAKLDDRMEYTGNFAIEFFNFCTDKPSGINITQSDYYIIKSSGKYYCIKSNDIKKIIELGLYHREIKNDCSKLYLVARDKFIPYCRVLN